MRFRRRFKEKSLAQNQRWEFFKSPAFIRKQINENPPNIKDAG
jgi:hypothetical protein